MRKEFHLFAVVVATVAGLWRSAFAADSIDDASFKPVKEAELPQDFPTYTPVGKIEVKQYPAYRRASASGIAEFWMLFRHIQQNNVAMTAPVELDMGTADAARVRQRSMSFLYERPDQGSTGKQGFVEVNDVPAMQVLSIGCRGERTTASTEAARRRLLAWLDEHKRDYVVAGSLRIMGYNSPFLPAARQFYEVQIPVRPREKSE